MTCFLDKKEDEHRVDQLSQKLATRYDVEKGKNVTDDSLVELYRPFAFHMLAHNMHNPPEKDPDGNPSDLYMALKEIYGNDNEAAVAKSYIYTDEFKQQYGYWEEEGKPEPTFESLKQLYDGGSLKTDFDNHIKQLLPNISSSELRRINLWFQDCLYSQIFSDKEIDSHHPGFDENGLAMTISKDRDIVVGKQMLEYERKENERREKDGEPLLSEVEKIIKRRDLTRQYNEDKLDELVNSTCKRLANVWGLQFNESGTVTNPIKKPTDAEKKAWWKLVSNDATKNIPLITPYEICEWRCMLINTMKTRAKDPYMGPVIMDMIKNMLRGGSDRMMTKQAFDTWIDIYRKSDLFVKALEYTGLLKKNENGIYTDASINEAVLELKKEFDRAFYQFDSLYKFTTKSDRIVWAFHNFFQNLGMILTQFVRGFVRPKGWDLAKNASKVWKALEAVPYSTVAVAGTVALNVAFPQMGLLLAALSSIGVQYLINTSVDKLRWRWMSSILTSNEYHKTVREIMMAFAVNQDLSMSKDGLLGSTLFELRGDSVDMILHGLLKSIKSLKVSAESRAALGSTTKDQLEQLDTLKTLCEEAINEKQQSGENEREYIRRFLVLYIRAAQHDLVKTKKLIYDSKDLLNAGKLDQVNIGQLMRMKVDVLGAYTETVNRGIKSIAYMFDKFDPSGDSLNHQLLAIVLKEIDVAKNEFDQMLDLYTEKYNDEFLKETAKKSINPELYERLRSNMQKWFKNQIENGHLGIFDKYIYSARTSNSPVIRAAHQRLAEIETLCMDEAGKAGALIESLRVQQRSFWSRSFFNPMNKYAERNADGTFSAYFKSDTKLGLYDQDYQKITKKLTEKYKIERLPGKRGDNDGAYVWMDGDETVYKCKYKDETGTHEYDVCNVGKSGQLDKWQAYNILLTLWMAGATEDKDGTFVLTKDAVPRVHRRYTYRYYIDKTTILGREGTRILADTNARLNELYKDCKQDLEINGKTVSVPIPSKLSPERQIQLKLLLEYKKRLSSPYYIRFDDNMTNILEVKPKYKETNKDNQGLRLILRFALWEEKKRSYYDQNVQPTYEVHDAVKQWYLDRILKLRDSNNDDAANILLKEYNDFLRFSQTEGLKHEVLEKFTQRDKIVYDTSDPRVVEYLSLLQVRRAVKSYLSQNTPRGIPDLTLLGDWSLQNGVYTNLLTVRKVWRDLTHLDKLIEDLENGDPKLPQLDKIVYDKTGKIPWEKAMEYKQVPLFEYKRDEETGELKLVESGDFYNKRLKPLLDDNILRSSDIKYSKANSLNKNFAKLLSYVDVKKSFLNEKKLKLEDLYETKPIWMYAQSQLSVTDKDFDTTSDSYYQVNKLHPDYDNRAEWEELKKDEFYKNLLLLNDMIWDNYKGMTRRNRFQMPQMEASKSDMFGRVFITKGSWLRTLGDAISYSLTDMYKFKAKDVELNNDIHVTADGTVVNSIPHRFISKLENPNLINTDLVSSVIDSYEESLRYKYRMKMEPVMQALHFQLSGKFAIASDAGSKHQAQLLKNEMDRALYGRELTGSGEGGRITQAEAKMVKLSKLFRSALHKRLMSHNWNSVLKNGWDSFCNLLTAAYNTKIILTLNIVHAIGNIIYDKRNKLFSLFGELSGFNRSRPGNLEQALMLMLGINNTIHERFEKQNKWALRRFLNRTANLEFEFVDYKIKEILTGAVFDAYRLIYSPLTNKYEFMTENQAEYAYGNVEQGYNKWNDAKNQTLRMCYRQNKKTGAAELVDEFTYFDERIGENVTLKNTAKDHSLLDLIRPMSSIAIADKMTIKKGDVEQLEPLARSRVLETQVRTTIKQLVQTTNGMLDKEDKNELARNYVGAVIMSFRGWMVSQASEFYKQGVDFHNYEDQGTTGVAPKTFNNIIDTQLAIVDKGVSDKDYYGQFNFATGTVDYGLHRNLLSAIIANGLEYVSMMSIVGQINLTGNTKMKYISKGKMGQREYYQLRNAAAVTDFMILTIALTAMAMTMYRDDDNEDDNPVKILKSLVYMALLSSVSERFPQMGTFAFLSSVSDLIKSLTVGVVMLDDFKYIMNVVGRLSTALSDTIEDETTDEVLANGSFKGEKRSMRDITKAMAMLNIDTLPALLILQGISNSENSPEWMQDIDFLDYNLNMRKNWNIVSQDNVRKWYADLIPTPMFRQWLREVGIYLYNKDLDKDEKDKKTDNKPKSNKRKLKNPYL